MRGKKEYGGKLRAGHARPLQSDGRFMATNVGGGVLDAPQGSKTLLEKQKNETATAPSRFF